MCIFSMSKTKPKTKQQNTHKPKKPEQTNKTTTKCKGRFSAAASIQSKDSDIAAKKVQWGEKNVYHSTDGW